MKSFFLSKKFWLLVTVMIVGIFVWYTLSTQKALPEGIELGVVQKGEVVETVSETGFVKVARSVDLAFERGGRVASSTVKEGDRVKEGQTLMFLDASEQKSNLMVAQARLEAEQVRLQELIAGADSTTLAVTESGVASAEIALQNAEQNLAEVTTQQNQLVQNARKTLLSSALQAYLISDERENSSYSYTAPSVTGSYTGNEEGFYRLELYNSSAPSGASFRVSGLEEGTQSVSTVNPTAIGTKGLHVQFPENFAKNTEWEIPVPNTRSSTYQTNLNAYNAVLEARNVTLLSAKNAVKTAEASLNQAKSQLTQVSSSARNERVAAQQALVRQMEALVSQAQVIYDNTFIVAPFSGVVTKVNTEVGQIVPPSVPIVRIISENDHELVVDIAEVDIAEVNVGDSAVVTFDAYDDVELSAKVSNVSPNAKDVSGVRVFTVTLLFDSPNELVKEGLTAQIDIIAATRRDVITIPTRSIYENDQGKFVRAFSEDGHVIEMDVTVGLRGSNGMTEIMGGLSEGTEIITFATEELIAQIKKN